MELTQDRLKELLIYCTLTGRFMWKVSRGNKKVGSVAGTNTDNYIIICIDGEAYLAHRLAFLCMEGEFPPNDVDHINRLTRDNSWQNLRKCTRSENMNNPNTVSIRQAIWNSEEFKDKMSKANKGVPKSDTHKFSLRTANKGKGLAVPKSEETKNRMKGNTNTLTYHKFIKEQQGSGMSYIASMSAWRREHSN